MHLGWACGGQGQLLRAREVQTWFCGRGSYIHQRKEGGVLTWEWCEQGWAPVLCGRWQSFPLPVAVWGPSQYSLAPYLSGALQRCIHPVQLGTSSLPTGGINILQAREEAASCPSPLAWSIGRPLSAHQSLSQPVIRCGHLGASILQNDQLLNTLVGFHGHMWTPWAACLSTGSREKSKVKKILAAMVGYTHSPRRKSRVLAGRV